MGNKNAGYQHFLTMLSTLSNTETIILGTLNSLLNNEIVDWSSLKTSADNKIYVTEKLKFVLGRVVNIMCKGENAGWQHFLLFP